MTAIISIVNVICIFLYVSLVARSVTSWLKIDPSNPLHILVKLAYQITEPFLAPIRRILPKGTVDFSPMVAIIIVAIIQEVVRAALGH